MEADLLRFYGVDLLDFYRGKLTLRRVAVLLKHLPRDAELTQLVDPSASWSNSDYLSALIVDALNGLSWLTVEVNRGKGRKAPYPEPIARPGAPEGARTSRPGESRRQRTVANLPRLQGPQLAEWLNGA